MTNHRLKIKYEFAQLHFQQKKDGEIRKDDRDFKIGDTIIFSVIEFGFMYSCTITNIFRDTQYGLQDGYVILSIKNITKNETTQSRQKSTQ
jgi:hypothetical protein